MYFYDFLLSTVVFLDFWQSWRNPVDLTLPLSCLGFCQHESYQLPTVGFVWGSYEGPSKNHCHFKKPVNLRTGSGSTTNSMWYSPHWTAINCSWSRCPPFFASRSPQAFQVSSDLNNNTSSPRKWGHLSDIKCPMGNTIHGWRLHEKWYLSLCLIKALHPY